MQLSTTAVSKTSYVQMLGRSSLPRLTSSNISSKHQPPKGPSRFCVTTAIVESKMLPPLFSLTNGKSFISPQNTKLYNSHNFT